MKKIYYLILLSALPFLAQSCLMEDKDLFDQTAAERLEGFIKENSEVLTSSENGWILEYYADENQVYGGYAYVVKFTKSDVTAYCELAGSIVKGNTVSDGITSLYNIVADDSAVLTFDTYNDYLHYFATPNINDYEAKHGDYEFNLTSISADKSEVSLRGVRTNNQMTLRRLNVAPEVYLQKVLDMEYNVLARKHDFMLDGAIDAKCEFSEDANIISYSYGANGQIVTGEIPFCHTDLGIRFYEPVDLNGVKYESLIYSDGLLTSNDGRVVIVIGPKPIG